MDLRIEHIFREEMKGDTSFQERDSVLRFLVGCDKYTKQEMRETWHNGIKHGIEIGLRKAGIDGQKIELNANTVDDKHKEFLERFYQLTDEYNCAIQYHPEFGLVIIKR